MIIKKELIEELDKIRKEQEENGIFVNYIHLDVLMNIIKKLDIYEGISEDKILGKLIRF